MESLTPGLPRDDYSLCKAEDSGYHTSLTPGSMDCSEILNENTNPSFSKSQFCYELTPDDKELKLTVHHKRCNLSTPIGSNTQYHGKSPSRRRAFKRSYTHIDYNVPSLPTPTSSIAGAIQNLNFSDSRYSPKVLKSENFNNPCYEIILETSESMTLSYPTTPVKKVCVSDDSSPTNTCVSSPLRSIHNLHCQPKRSAKKLNFSASLADDESAFYRRPKRDSKIVRSIFKPKGDIITMLCTNVRSNPPIKLILEYLSDEDIYNYSQVTPVWDQICDIVPDARDRQKKYQEYVNFTKENCKNRNNTKEETIKSTVCKEKITEALFKDIHNTVGLRNIKMSPIKSPPTTPRSRRFKTFTKSASLDSRCQFPCMKCRQPAKLTENDAGEEWMECIFCKYQFCRFCKSEKQVCAGKKCFKFYDLESLSPRRRKLGGCRIGTKKSKGFLKRL